LPDVTVNLGILYPANLFVTLLPGIWDAILPRINKKLYIWAVTLKEV